MWQGDAQERKRERDEESRFELEQEERAKQALASLPARLRDFYEPHFQIQGDHPPGTFIGLVCRTCKRWRDSHAAEDCPVARLEAEGQ